MAAHFPGNLSHSSSNISSLQEPPRPSPSFYLIIKLESDMLRGFLHRVLRGGTGSHETFELRIGVAMKALDLY
jgi:hypothetical protein